MWLCTNKSFLSIVTHPDDAGLLLVRARRKGDIENLFSDADVKRTPGRDYLYRAAIRREVVSAVVAKAFAEINYQNFKNSVIDDPLHRAYMEVWRVMSVLQTVKPYGTDSAAARKKEGVTAKRSKVKPRLLKISDEDI